MHGGNRRRKKRPTYGVRTVEITKGLSGFGFTISGQAPCILSCIVPGSPAEKAGLRPGDFLIAVNSKNVSKALHDDVVRIIGQSKLLKLQIAENYYSDSSDEEFNVNRPKPKYPNRLRHKHQQTRAEKVVRDLQSGAIFSEHAAIHNSENAPLSDRDWAEPYPSSDHYLPPNTASIQATIGGPTNMHSTPKPSVSPTRLRPDQVRIVMTEALQVSRTPHPLNEELPMHPPRVRQVLKKREKMLKGTPKFQSSGQQQAQKNLNLDYDEKQDSMEENELSESHQQQPSQIHQQLLQTHQHQQSQSQMLHHSQQQHPKQQQLNQLQQDHQPNQQILRQQQQQKQQKEHQKQPQHRQHPLAQQNHLEQEQSLESCQPNQQDIERIAKSQMQLNQQPLQQKQNFQHHHIHNNNHLHSHKQLQKVMAMQNLYCPQNQEFQENSNQSISSHQHPNLPYRQQNKQQDTNQPLKAYPHQPSSQMAQYIRQQHLNRQLNKQGMIKLNQSDLYHSQLLNAYASDSSCNGITEQEINNILYPTLAEIQQNQVPRDDIGEVVYRAVVGYLGTIEMPKEPQGGSRLTAIRNCIRRLRIEKKVHTLVLMSILNEQVILTNPHGLTLAEYPAERITFCGVYADDKKFFGLVTVHGSSEDELSDASRDDGSDPCSSASSSCHVFMVDPNAIHHPDHCRRAKNFRIECTPAPVPVQEEGTSHCLEFPDSADPILHSIMSLYRNRVGFHLDTGAPGLIDVDAQMSPQHSNTSSNSSNSDSGIGFRDEGGHHYHNSDRVFVVEFDDNQRTRLQNVQIIDNMRAGVRDNQRSIINNTISNNICANGGETSDNSLPSTSLRNGVEKKLLAAGKGLENGNCSRMNNHDKFSKGGLLSRSNAKSNIRQNENTSSEMDENLRVSVCDPKKLKELRINLLEGKKSILEGRKSVTEELEMLDSNLILQVLTPGRECTSPQDGNRLTVRAMPDPVNFERSPGLYLGNEFPIQVSSMRHSMHKYLQHKQEHLMKVSQKINRRESDSGSVSHPLNVRAFSPAVGKRTPTPSCKNSQAHRNMDLTLKLSPKVFGVPFRSSAPSEHSFTRSLEDLRDSSTSDGVSGSMGVGGGSFRDGSESDHGLARLLHASETNLVRSSPTGSYSQEVSRGAFRAVHPRSRRTNHIEMLSSVAVLPSVGRLSDVNGMRDLPCLRNIGSVVSRPLDSGDENTETTENTGGQGGSQDVHPPTQDEFSHDSDFEQVEGSEEKKPRGVSLRRLSRTRHNNERPPATSDSNATQSDTEVGKISGPVIRISNGGLGPDTPLELSRVGSWAVSFEKLIEDPAGLHTFAEFLKKEYSHENIYFWTACERYKNIVDDDERREVAKTIFERHLGMTASEPVNVDSQARQVAQDGLYNPDEFLFSAAQKQIFNLMKFDSYSRFLKSDLYNKCVTQDRKGLPLPYPGDDSLDPDLGVFSENSFSSHLKKSKSDAEERRRKSLLPWHRKDRSKSKDRGEAEYWRRKKLGHRTPSESSSARYDLSDSHTSLSSSDYAPGNRAVSKESLTSGEAVSLSGSEGLSLCRFILPDQSNSVLAVRSGETVKELVRQLLDRRRINFTEFNVVLTKGNKIVDLNKDSTVLGGHEARLERMVLFSLYLPSRKTVIVKAKPHKLVSEVLKPILSKYGLKLDLMVIHKYGESKGISIKGSVTDLDGEKLIVQTKEEVKEWSEPGRAPKRNNTLDEITNKVFEDLLNGKTKSSFDDLGVLDFDSRSTKTDPTSDTSSLIESFGRRESLSLERNLPSRQSGGGRGLLNDSTFAGKRNPLPPSYNVKSKQENADLYEGLKRAQMYRLDDQRGTEINFELPDFLKSDRGGQGTTLLSHFDHSFHSNSSDGTEQSEFLSRAHPEVWGGVQGSTPGGDNTLIAPADLDLDDLEETLRPMEHDKLHDVNSSCNNNNNTNKNSGVVSQSPFLTPPPPLPPKPKLGGPLRGPPPRPPSRQLPPLSHSLHLLDVPIHMATSRQSLSDKLNVSFV